MVNLVLVIRSLWPVLRRLAPVLAAADYHPEEADGWGALLDGRYSCHEMAGVFLGDKGNVDEEIEILRRFRQRNGVLGVPLFLIGGISAFNRQSLFRAAGVDMLLPADLSPEAIVEQAAPLLRYGSLYQTLAAANRELREQSLRDDLTGLPNRRHFSMDLKRNVEMARRIGRPLSCIIVDIDNFKRINDTYGHPAGDNVIRQFSSVINRAKRTSDSVARLGGDEFAWLLVDADPGRALQAASRAQRLVNDSTFEAEDDRFRVTATFGVSSIVPGAELSADDLVGNADRALYWGKESGKNIVRFYPPKRPEDEEEQPDATPNRYIS